MNIHTLNFFEDLGKDTANIGKFKGWRMAWHVLVELKQRRVAAAAYKSMSIAEKRQAIQAFHRGFDEVKAVHS